MNISKATELQVKDREGKHLITVKIGMIVLETSGKNKTLKITQA